MYFDIIYGGRADSWGVLVTQSVLVQPPNRYTGQETDEEFSGELDLPSTPRQEDFYGESGLLAKKFEIRLAKLALQPLHVCPAYPPIYTIPAK